MWIAEDFEFNESVSIEQFACESQGADGVFGAITTRRIG
jgi:hypothetical protein